MEFDWKDTRDYGSVADNYTAEESRDRFFGRGLCSFRQRDLPRKRRLLLRLAVSGSLCACVCAT